MFLSSFLTIICGVTILGIFLTLVFMLIDRQQPGFWPSIVNWGIVTALLLVALGSVLVGWYRFGRAGF